MARTVKPLTEREEMLVAYGHIISARSLQVDGVGRLMLALDRLPQSERGNLHRLAEEADEAMRRLRMAMARVLEI
jgi:hypothetical protein